LVTVAALAGASAAQAAGVGVTQISSLPAGAKVGTLTGVVTNETGRAARADVSVRVLRRGTGGALIGRTSVDVAAHATKRFLVGVRLPRLKKGTYYVAACTPQGGADKAALGCATSAADLKIAGGDPLRGRLAQRQFASQGKARAAQAQCSPGARSLVKPGDRVWPELGNGGYQSIHSDLFIVYDATTNKFLPGNHVDLTQKATQCLTEFSLDFDRHSSISQTAAVPGSDLTVQSITIDGVPATFVHRQPSYPGNPNGPDDPDPRAHAASNTNPVSATNPFPPACAPTGNGAAAQGAQCGETKLVITPAQPIPAGTTFKVTVNYTGQPGIRSNPSLGNEGWFKSNTPAGDGAMVTSEPSGSMAWMPLNNHVSVKPTYDVHSTVNYDPAAPPEANRVFIGPGRRVSTVVNPPDANYPTGSRTFHWHSAEPIGSYLVENSVGHFDAFERMATTGDVIYYEFQSSGISDTLKARNKGIMDMQEDITHFQEQFNGPFPFNANGIVIALPNASFQEEMQTKIVFVGGNIGTTAEIFSHENMHQWWGDSVSYVEPRYTFFKEGYADASQYLFLADVAGKAAGPVGSAAYNTAFEAAIASRFAATNRYNTTSSTFWNIVPTNPTSGQLFGSSNTYNRPGQSYIALRAILGNANWVKVNREIQTDYKYGSITPEQVMAVYHKYLPNQSIGCHNKLDAFFKQWWFTSYSGPPAAGNKPSITGPGLAGNDHFYDADGGCSDYGVDQPGTVDGTVPATLSLTLGAPASFGTFAAGVDKDYTASTTATVISTAGNAALTVSPSPAYLVNGAFALPSPLQVSLSKSAWSAPTSNESVAVGFTQHIGATDALRTGAYSKTLTFTLSTTAP
jgi:hypothetical protein